MALLTETGTFTKDSTGNPNATNVVSTSFQPKGIIIWGVLQQVAESENAGDASHSLGFSDGTNSRCVDVRSEDAVARSDYLRAANNDAVLGFLDPAGTGFLAKATIAFNTSDFTVTWTTNNTDASRIHYIIYGGTDITGIQVGDFVKTTAAQPVNQSITTDADVQNITAGEGIVFFLHARRNAFNITTNDIFTQLGAASDTTEEAVFAAGGDDNDAVGDPFVFNLDDACIIGVSTATSGIDYEGEFNGFDALGFDINFRVNDGVTDLISFMIIKGGKWEVGTETAGTITGNKVTTTGHRPKGLLVIGNRQTATGRDDAIDQSYNIGASDATTETSGAWTDNDGAITMNVGRASSITKLARHFIVPTTGAPIIDGEANVDSFNALDFTLNWTNSATVAFRFMWVIAGDAVSVTEVDVVHTTDTLMQVITDVEHTTDVLIKAALTEEHTTDVLVKVLNNDLIHTTDVLIFQEVDVIHTTDILVKAALDVIHTSDTLIQVIDNDITHTTDTLVFIETDVIHTTDVLVKAALNVVHTTDIVVSVDDIDVVHTTDTLIQVVDNDIVHTTDVLIQVETDVTHSSDTLIQVIDNDIIHTTDILVKAALNVVHTTDSLIKVLDNDVTHSTDVLVVIRQLIVHTTDVLVQVIDNDLIHTTDTLIQVIDNDVTHTTDTLIQVITDITHTTDILIKVALDVTHSTDILIKVLDNDRIHTTDTLIQVVDNDLVHSTDILIFQQVDLTHSTDMLVQVETDVIHTTDTLIKVLDNDLLHTTDVLIQVMDTDITHTTDALIKVIDNSIVYTTDSLIQVINNDVVHTTDTLIYVTSDLTHSTDVFISAIPVFKDVSHSTDILIKVIAASETDVVLPDRSTDVTLPHNRETDVTLS